MFQLTKVGLPVNVVNGVNPLSNGMINPTGKKARTELLYYSQYPVCTQ